MTFGEKLQKLRKEAGMSQEELAARLDVSRQAVSKWERDSGYPETEKIVRMGRLFHVTMDYLLNEDTPDSPGTAPAGPAQAAGTPVPEVPACPVSRETAEGFLLYQKRKLRKIALAAGGMSGSLALSFTFTDTAQLLFMLIWIAAALLLLSVRLGGDPYRRLRQGPLQLDESARAYLDAACTEMTGRLQALTLTGAALTAAGLLFCPPAAPARSGRSEPAGAERRHGHGGGRHFSLHLRGRPSARVPSAPSKRRILSEVKVRTLCKSCFSYCLPRWLFCSAAASPRRTPPWTPGN